MASPPFDILQGKPADSDIVSQHPADERQMRDRVESALSVEHDMGDASSSKGARHKFGVGNDAARNAITDWVVGSFWLNTKTTPVSLQRVVSVGPVVWEDVTNGITLATNNTWTGTNTFTNTVTVSTTGTGDILELISTESGAAAAPGLSLYRNSSSPAAADVLGIIRFFAEDSVGNKDQFASIFASAPDVTSGTEDGRVGINTRIAGTTADRVFVGAGLYSNGATNGDPGANNINFSGYQRNGQAAQLIHQAITDTDSAVSTGTTVMPIDDTIPQNTEGDEYLSVTITPVDTNSTLIIEWELNVAGNAGGVQIAAALFQSGSADALMARASSIPATNTMGTMRGTYVMVAGTLSAITFTVRAGPESAATITVNGEAGARRFGGVAYSFLRVTEKLP